MIRKIGNRIECKQRARASILALVILSFTPAAHGAILRFQGQVSKPLLMPIASGGGVGAVGTGVGAAGLPGGFGGGIGAHGGSPSIGGGWSSGPGLGGNAHPHPSVIWYPPEIESKNARAKGQTCAWLYRKAQNAGTRYWRTRYNDCIR
jgi:hypothetical protein